MSESAKDNYHARDVMDLIAKKRGFLLLTGFLEGTGSSVSGVVGYNVQAAVDTEHQRGNVVCCRLQVRHNTGRVVS